MQIVEGFLRPGLKNGFPGDEVAAHPAASVFIECEDLTGILCLNPLQRRRRPRHSKDQDSRAAPPCRPHGRRRVCRVSPRFTAGARRPPTPSSAMQSGHGVYAASCGRRPWLLSSVRSPGVCMHGTPLPQEAPPRALAPAPPARRTRAAVFASRVFPSFLQGKLSGLVGAKL